MERIDLLKELQKLAPPERLAVIEAAVQQLRDGLEGTPDLKSLAVKKQEMAAAAQALQADYAAGGELTAFIALDAEDFQAQRGGLDTGPPTSLPRLGGAGLRARF